MIAICVVCFLVMGAMPGATADGDSFTVTYAENGLNLRQVGPVRQDDEIINGREANGTPFTFQPFEVFKKIGKTGEYVPSGYAQVSIDSPTDIPLYLPLDNQFNRNHHPESNSPALSHSLTPSHSPTPSHIQSISHSRTPSHSPTLFHSPTSKQLASHFPIDQSGTANNVYRLPSTLHPSVYDSVLSKMNQPILLPPINHPRRHPAVAHPRIEETHPRFNEVQADKTSLKGRFNLESSYFIMDLSKSKNKEIHEVKKLLRKPQFQQQEFTINKEIELSEFSRNVEMVLDHNGLSTHDQPGLSTHAQPFPGKTISSLKSRPTQSRQIPVDFTTFDAVP